MLKKLIASTLHLTAGAVFDDGGSSADPTYMNPDSFLDFELN